MRATILLCALAIALAATLPTALAAVDTGPPLATCNQPQTTRAPCPSVEPTSSPPPNGVAAVQTSSASTSVVLRGSAPDVQTRCTAPATTHAATLGRVVHGNSCGPSK